MGLFENFSADKKLQIEGKWVDYGDFSVCIAWAGTANPEYEKQLERHMRPFRKYLDSANMVMPAAMKKDLEKAYRRVYAKAVVLDWKDVKRGDEPFPYTPENCFDVFQELPSFFKEIQDYSSSLENYQQDVLEDDAKNS